MHKIIWIIFIILSSLFVHADIRINEIMPNPEDDETLNEWVELYNGGDSEIDVSGWIIGDLDSNDSIEGGLYNKEGTIIPPKGYAIITDSETRVYDNFFIEKDAIHLYIDDSSIGNSLGNDLESIFLYNANELISSMTYNETLKGQSLAFEDSGWHIANPTPGYNNNGSVEEINNNQCDYKVEIILNKTSFAGQSEFEFKIKATKISGSPTLISGIIQIEDSFGNIIKEYLPWTNDSISSHKTSSTYSPNLNEGTFYFIKANISVSCNEKNSENNIDERIFSISAPPPEPESKIEIMDVSNLKKDTAKFGQIINVKLKIYKGDTSKRVVNIYVNGKNQVSEYSKVEATEKFSEYSVAIPIQIYPNCNNEFEEGDYDVIAEGLGTKEKFEIEIEGITSSQCISKNTASIGLETQEFDFQVTDLPEEIYCNNEFPLEVKLTGDEKSHNITLWSYIYKGSKCYSNSREANKKQIFLDSGQSQDIILKNKIADAMPGDYKLKVIMNKDNQKTNKEIIKDITIKENKIIEKPVNQKNFNDFTGYSISASAVYESKEEKAKEITVYLLIITLALIVAMLVWKR